jgi:NAD-dependent SIR2 family protein deacetylase
MAYTGAGLSVAAGIGMAAVGSTALQGMGVARAGEPTLSHCVMAELNRQNLLHGWVQQNHDGLPQKAGYRQEDINEIHGSWFDPANPVVKYSGCLRGDLCEDMETQAQTTDLVLVLGTSLTGLNADQCVEYTAARATRGKALGSVIISPQRTAQDGKASLRIFAKADDVMTMLAAEFSFGPRAFGRGARVKRSADLFTKCNKVLVPYDKNGNRSTKVQTYWDLSPGQKVRLGSNHNVKGAQQPQDQHITSKTLGTIAARDEKTCSIGVNFEGVNKKLGLWWLETAMRGGVAQLPFVNVDAQEMNC